MQWSALQWSKVWEEFVLICPFGKSSGEISQILLQMFHSVCVLGIGVWPFWSKKKKRTAGVCCTDESKFCLERIRNPSHLRIFPVSLQSVPSVIRDVGIPQPIALIHLCLGTTCDHLASPVETLCLCQQWQTTNLHASSHRVHFYFVSAL